MESKLKKIIVAQWVGGNGVFEYDYSEEKRNELINQSLRDKLQLMMYEHKDKLIMYTDTKRFRQR